MLEKLKALGRKQVGYLMTSTLVILAALIVNPASIGAVTIALVSTYAVFAGTHAVTDVMGKPAVSEGS
jgi:hypothetical protein